MRVLQVEIDLSATSKNRFTQFFLQNLILFQQKLSVYTKKNNFKEIDHLVKHILQPTVLVICTWFIIS